jgi:hypothetical protein
MLLKIAAITAHFNAFVYIHDFELMDLPVRSPEARGPAAVVHASRSSPHDGLAAFYRRFP